MIMTPKEKAKDLVDKFYIQEIKYYENIVTAKQCALIAVDEISEELSEVLMVTASSYINKHIAYWQEVKQEIENL